MEIKVCELNQGDVFLFGNVMFEIVLPVASTETDLALCRITNQCANLYVSAEALVRQINSTEISGFN